MKLKLRTENENGIVRLENDNTIKEILINEDIVHPEKENIAICFKDKDSSGIVELSPAEFEKIYDAIKSRIHLIKGFRRLTGEGAIRL
jgi:hypothetical protein